MLLITEIKRGWMSLNFDSINFVRNIGKKLTEVTGDPLESSYLFQRLSVANQRGNAISFTGTMADFDY